MKLHRKYKNVIKRRKELLTEMLDLGNVPSFIIFRQLKLIQENFLQWLTSCLITKIYFIFEEGQNGK